MTCRATCPPHVALFSESASRAVVSVAPEREERARGSRRRPRRAVRPARGDRRPAGGVRRAVRDRRWTSSARPTRARSRGCSASSLTPVRMLEAVTFDFWDTLVARTGTDRRCGTDRSTGSPTALLAARPHARAGASCVDGVRRELDACSRRAGKRTPASTRPPTRTRLHLRACWRVRSPPALRADARRRRSTRWASARPLRAGARIDECLRRAEGRGGAAGDRLRRRADPFAHAPRPPRRVRPARGASTLVVQRRDRMVQAGPRGVRAGAGGARRHDPSRAAHVGDNRAHRRGGCAGRWG